MEIKAGSDFENYSRKVKESKSRFKHEKIIFFSTFFLRSWSCIST